MTTPRIPVGVEGLPQKRYAEILLHPYPAEILNKRTTSGAVAWAVGSLLEHPEQPIAVLVESGTENEHKIAEDQGSAKRLLARAAPEGWYFAFAIPTLESWLLTDPKVKALLAAHSQDGRNAIERSERIAGLLAGRQFDATELLRTNADFRGLVDFLTRQSAALAELEEEVST
jgi:hypothetical protein